MYKIKYCHTDLQLEEFIDKVNENNYEIISITNFKDKLTIIYKTKDNQGQLKEETKKTRKRSTKKEGE